MLSIAYISFIGVTAIVCSYFTTKKSLIAYKLLLVLLVLTFFNELISYYFSERRMSTYFQYNIFYYIRFPLFAGIFHSLYLSKRINIFLPVLFYVITPVMLIALGIMYGFKQLHTQYLLAGGIMVIICSVFYLYKIILPNENTNPFIQPFFWIATASMLYFLTILPSLGIINLLVKKEMIFATQRLTIVRWFNFPLYAFICLDYYLQWKHRN